MRLILALALALVLSSTVKDGTGRAFGCTNSTQCEIPNGLKTEPPIGEATALPNLPNCVNDTDVLTTTTVQCRGMEDRCLESTDGNVTTENATLSGCDPGYCPGTGSHIMSVNLGNRRALARIDCCNTSGCNRVLPPAPDPQAPNNKSCLICDHTSASCNTSVQCRGVEDRCLESTVTNVTGTAEAYGCASSNLCGAAARLNKISFLKDSFVGLAMGPIVPAPSVPIMRPCVWQLHIQTELHQQTHLSLAVTLAIVQVQALTSCTGSHIMSVNLGNRRALARIDCCSTSGCNRVFPPAQGLFCNVCNGSNCSRTFCSNNETMCMAATYSDGNVTTENATLSGCDPGYCPGTGSHIMSVNLGNRRALARIDCCNTSGCNRVLPPAPDPQAPNNQSCLTCDHTSASCNTSVQCRGVEDRCLESTVTNVTGTAEAYGCASSNLCGAAARLNKISFINKPSEFNNTPNCVAQGLFCNVCNGSNCSRTFCSNNETMCMAATYSVTNVTGTAEAYGCASSNLCGAAARLNKIPFINKPSEFNNTPNCVDPRLFCHVCNGSSCYFQYCSNNETMCMAATYSDGNVTTANASFSGCDPGYCPSTDSHMMSANLGNRSTLAMIDCCKTSGCNHDFPPGPAPQAPNNKSCLTCDHTSASCNTSVQCRGVEDRCLESTAPDPQAPNNQICLICDHTSASCNTSVQCRGVEDRCLESTVNNVTGTAEAYGCASSNLCGAAGRLNEIPFVNKPSELNNTLKCVSGSNVPPFTALTTTAAAPISTTSKQTSTTTTQNTAAAVPPEDTLCDSGCVQSGQLRPEGSESMLQDGAKWSFRIQNLNYSNYSPIGTLRSVEVPSHSLGPGVLQYETGGGGFGSEHAHEVQVELGRVEVLKVAYGGLLVITVLLPGGDPVLGLDIPQRVVVRTDVVWTAKHFSDN
ncbi:hypothetical protein INR49_021392 [Caranx melampygus]|nr:hypothetical protein INR49_021392 [Caranx melampygus]